MLLWLHGGPGGAERPLFRYFNSELENHFVVVYWDQRGAGRSFDPKADPHRLTIAQHVADLDAVVDHLRQSLSQDKIILMGHSWERRSACYTRGPIRTRYLPSSASTQ